VSRFKFTIPPYTSEFIYNMLHVWLSIVKVVYRSKVLL